MSTLKIWGRMSSINVKKTVWTAQELGLDFERHEAGGVHGVVKTPPYIALNPNSQIPVLQDNDYVLWESNVINAIFAPSIQWVTCILTICKNVLTPSAGWSGNKPWSTPPAATVFGIWFGCPQRSETRRWLRSRTLRSSR